MEKYLYLSERPFPQHHEKVEVIHCYGIFGSDIIVIYLTNLPWLAGVCLNLQLLLDAVCDVLSLSHHRNIVVLSLLLN